LRDRIKDFKDRRAQILAVDPHESYRVRHMLRDVGLKADAVAFPVLADAANTVSATYGVAFQMNIHTEWSNRPATFVLDKEGRIRYERRGQTFGDRPKPDEILKELDRLAGRGEQSR
jgi:peroxiredoxin